MLFRSHIRWQRHAAILWLLLTAGRLPEAGAAETNQGPTILFLQVELSATNQPKLVKLSEPPGELKRQPTQEVADGIHFELLTSEGRSLWQGAVADPNRRTIEHESGARTGRMTRREITTANTIEITVRVPGRTEGRSVAFYTLTPGATNQSTQRKKLGTLPLPTK